MLEWTAAISVISAVVSTLVPILGFLRFIYKELKLENKRLDEELRILNAKFEEERRIHTAKYEEERKIHTARVDQFYLQLSARSDQLHQEFIDLLKSQKPKSRP